MNQYVTKFIGKISWEGRANGLPEEVYAFLFFQGEGQDSGKFISENIEKEMGKFISYQGMGVAQVQGDVIDPQKIAAAKRMFVPMRWIVKITVEVRPITGEFSTPDEEGVERLENGNEPLKQ